MASVRRDLTFFGRFVSGAVVSAVLFFAAPAARAASTPSMYCPIASAPLLSTSRGEGGADCSLDEDGNGLSDNIEQKLASCFAPAVAFDSHEDALEKEDPRVLFSARIAGTNLIHIRYVYLFTRDTGYTRGADFPCLKYEHNGDLQLIEMEVTWTEHDHEWFGVPLAIHATTIDQMMVGSWEQSELRNFAYTGTHPILYATAGKHHWSYREANVSYGCDCGPFGRCGSVRESADGRGAHIVPTFAAHTPGFYWAKRSAPLSLSHGAPLETKPQSPLAADGVTFSNTCEFRKSGRIVPLSPAFLTNDLSEIGYSGEVLHGPCFRGGLGGDCLQTGTVAEALSWGEPFAAVPEHGKLLAWLLGTAGRFVTTDARDSAFVDRLLYGHSKTVPIQFQAIAGKSRLAALIKRDAVRQ